MLTTQELTEARDTLSAAKALIEAVKATFFASGDVSGARLLNEVIHAVDDEIAALDKKIAAKP